MLVALYVGRAAAGWGIVLLRLPLLRRAGTPRAFWVCMLSCAAGATLQIPLVYKHLALFLGDGRYAPGVLLSAAIAAALAVRTVLVTFSGRPARAARWDWFAGAVACAVTWGALVGAHRVTNDVCVGSCGFIDTTWRSWLHWLPVLGVYAWTMISACVFCHRYRAACDRPALRKGLWLVGAGSALCLSWVVVRLAVLVAWHQGGVPTAWRSLDDWAEASIWAVSMGAVAVGALWEPLTLHLGTTAQWAHDLRSLWRLRGLWKALVELHPDVVLVSSSLTLRPRLRLVRRVVEIRDCLREIELDASPDALAAIQAHVDAMGVTPGPAADAWVTAAMVSSALSYGRERAGSGCRLPVADGRDLGSLVEWLEDVARLFRGEGASLAQTVLSKAGLETQLLS